MVVALLSWAQVMASATDSKGSAPVESKTSAPPRGRSQRRKELSAALDALFDATGLLPPLNRIVADYAIRNCPPLPPPLRIRRFCSVLTLALWLVCTVFGDSELLTEDDAERLMGMY